MKVLYHKSCNTSYNPVDKKAKRNWVFMCLVFGVRECISLRKYENMNRWLNDGAENLNVKLLRQTSHFTLFFYFYFALICTEVRCKRQRRTGKRIELNLIRKRNHFPVRSNFSHRLAGCVILKDWTKLMLFPTNFFLSLHELCGDPV